MLVKTLAQPCRHIKPKLTNHVFKQKLKKDAQWQLRKKQSTEQRNKKNRALVVLAEADVPKAMADAFRNGNFGVMDYYNMKNVIADTDMRSSIAGDSPEA